MREEMTRALSSGGQRTEGKDGQIRAHNSIREEPQAVQGGCQRREHAAR